jgi:hypothetical protein
MHLSVARIPETVAEQCADPSRTLRVIIRGGVPAQSVRFCTVDRCSRKTLASLREQPLNSPSLASGRASLMYENGHN